VTVELLKGAVRVLAGLRYDDPDQDRRYRLNRIPTRPPQRAHPRQRPPQVIVGRRDPTANRQ
jgi:hypothetical protein